jgi:hypothetical protein
MPKGSFTFAGHAPHRREPQLDCRRGKVSLLEVIPIAEDDRAVGMRVEALNTDHGSLRLFEIRQS